MKMKAMKCPQCSANLDVEEGLDTFYCKYCGSRIVVEDQDKDVIKAKVRLQELKHEEKMLDSVMAHKRFEMKQQSAESKRMLILGIVLLVGSMLAAGLFLLIYEFAGKKEEKRLEQIVVEVQELIDDKKYDEALVKAEQIVYSAENEKWTMKRKWNKIRKDLIKQIEEAKNIYKDSNGIAMTLDSSDIKGMPYSDAVELLSGMGFSNISAVELSDKPGLFHKSGDVKTIVVDGDTKFKVGDKYLPDVQISIEYYSEE